MVEDSEKLNLIPILNAQGQVQWNKKADFWDNLHGDAGNVFHRTLVEPAIEKLLQVQKGESVLDIACGNGVLARRLAELGAIVTATDFSHALLEKARNRGQRGGEPIRYIEVDATNEASLAALGEGVWDGITCTMAFMDMATIKPLMRAVKRLLKPNGRFVFVTAHPSFNSNNPIFEAQMEDIGGELVMTYSLKIKAYIDIEPSMQVGSQGEPTPHYYYHRSLQALLSDAFEAGLVLDGLDEPTYPPNSADAGRLITWRHVWQMPPVLAGRLRIR